MRPNTKQEQEKIFALVQLGLKYNGSSFVSPWEGAPFVDVALIDVLTYDDKKFNKLISELSEIVPVRDLFSKSEYEIDCEIVEEAKTIDVFKAVVVTQKPIIAYDTLAEISTQVKDKIESLNIDTLEPSEETLKNIKDTRIDLSKEFKTLEEQRKMVKEIVLKDYNEFEDNYKRLIADQFKTADAKLKTLVDSVEDGILSKKVEALKAYFDEQNAYEFLRFEDLGLHIIKSKSDKSIKEEIDAYIMCVAANLLTIDTLQNKERILAKYHMTKDLNLSISQVNMEIQREEAIKAREAQIKAQQEATIAKNAQVEQPKKEIPVEVVYVPKDETADTKEDEVFQCTFTVFATKEQLKNLKQFMKNEGISYE